MAHELHVNECFFRSEFVPAMSILSGSTDDLIHATWTFSWPVGARRAHADAATAVGAASGPANVKFPCARAEQLQVQYLQAGDLTGLLLFIAGIFAVACLSVAADRFGDAVAGGVFLIGAVVVVYAAALNRRRRSARFHAEPTDVAGTLRLHFPAQQENVFRTFSAAIASWEQAGRPVPIPPEKNDDPFADQVAPGWDSALPSPR
ncbi:MAG: hypothetical protein ACREJ2_01685 [Planctomycetota bacterium]